MLKFSLFKIIIDLHQRLKAEKTQRTIQDVLLKSSSFQSSRSATDIKEAV